MKTPKKENVDYKFVDNPDPDLNAPLQVLKGNFENVVYRYGEVEFGSIEEEKETVQLKFQFQIIDPGSSTIDNLRNDPKFVHEIGTILESIFLEEMETKLGEMNES